MLGNLFLWTKSQAQCMWATHIPVYAINWFSPDAAGQVHCSGGRLKPSHDQPRPSPD